jgi:flavocytochrome c
MRPVWSQEGAKVNNSNETFDIVVIGSGFAGLAAAIEAREAGASVVVLEKMRAPGGNSIISDGGIAAAGTALQEKFGYKDSPELMYSDMMKAGLGLNHPELVRVVAEKSNEVFQWSIDHLGIPYMDRVDHFGGHSVHRCYTAAGRTGATIIHRQIEKLNNLGVEIRLGVFLKTFIRNPEGRVCGVQVREDFDHINPEAGTENVINAGKAVILTTGGFGSDVAFRVTQDPRLTAEVDTTNKRFATAEALKEALKLGAAPVHLSHIQLGPWTSPDEKGFGDGPVFADYIVFLYGIVVDPVTGKRIINELGDRKTLSDAFLAVGHPCVGIADSKAVDSQGWDLSRGLKKGVIRKFQRLKDLASGYDIPLNELQATVERFNGFITDKLDRDFGKPILDDASPVDKSPYYGIRLWPKVHFTMGGVQINVRGQVVDLDQVPIGGLYAAGEVTGGVHGACRLGSCAITECLVFGRIAGRNAAADKP